MASVGHKNRRKVVERKRKVKRVTRKISQQVSPWR
ncbi:hypothetical protein QN277_010636 [Acacia crassicarpa]|uniref:Uncharacterized protein n=1 Tax=Acacia crassicarpa TaxID=499986 RepID=A0AAE1M8G4_9FABA|nr:hypothetical protein QN277_010636 [Acacia crassicarpa]